MESWGFWGLHVKLYLLAKVFALRLKVNLYLGITDIGAEVLELWLLIA